MSTTSKPARGYTRGMKTAVSIPDDVFKKAERLAKRLKRSRSRLYADALREYVKRHDSAAVTAAMNEWIEKHGQPADPVLLAYSMEMLRRVEW